MPEHLALQQLLAKCRTIHRNKSLLPPHTIPMDRLGENLLPRTRLAGQQHRNFRPGHLPCQLYRLPDRPRLSQNHIERILLPHLFFQTLQTPRNLHLFHRPAQQRNNLIIIVPFRNIIERPILYGLYSVGNIPVSRQQDNLRQRFQPLQLLHQFHPAPIRQTHIAQHHIGIHLIQHLQAGLTAIRLKHLVSFQTDNPGQQAT